MRPVNNEAKMLADDNEKKNWSFQIYLLERIIN